MRRIGPLARGAIFLGAALALGVSAWLAPACGKKGPPVPYDVQQTQPTQPAQGGGLKAMPSVTDDTGEAGS